MSRTAAKLNQADIARELRVAKTNSAASVKLLPRRGESFTPWTETDLEAYREGWQPGTAPQVEAN